MAMIMLASQCSKQSLIISARSMPTAILISTEAILLDTLAFSGNYYMHFLITFDVIAGDSDMYFSQVPTDFKKYVDILGSDTIHDYTPYRPMTITDLPEVEPEMDVYKIRAQDTARITYFGLVIAHGPWSDFYMKAYKFPYSTGRNDGTYESSITLKQSFQTDRPH